MTWSLSAQISDASGQMKVTCVEPSSPFKQAVLSPDECYILDNGVDGNIFVWKGVNSRDGLLVDFCANSIRRRRPGSDVDRGVPVKGNGNVSVRLPPNRSKCQRT